MSQREPRLNRADICVRKLILEMCARVSQEPRLLQKLLQEALFPELRMSPSRQEVGVVSLCPALREGPGLYLSCWGGWSQLY